MPDQEGGNPPSQADKGAGDGPRAPTACRLSPDEGGGGVSQRALPAHGMPRWEEGIPRTQEEEEEEGVSPKQRVLPGAQTQTNNQRGPPEKCAPPVHGVEGGGGGLGPDPSPKGRGGDPPSSCARPAGAG